MSTAELLEPAKATQAYHANYRPQGAINIAPTYVAASAGMLLEEKLTDLFAAGMIGWIIGLLATAPHTVLDRQVYFNAQSENAKRVSKLWQQVDEMASLSDDWNGYGSEAPNEFARDIAQQILLSSTKIMVPARVAPSAQGGVGICFYSNDKYGDIECLNTGEILATTSDRKHMPDVWEVKLNESKGALERIAKFISS